jgi:hypothetical protein
VTGSEIAFLAMGLVLGIVAGAALIATLRSRFVSPHEVRVTVAPDAVPRRRAATLANDAFDESPVAVAPATGGPADRAALWPTSGGGGSPSRTPVLPPRPGTVAEPAFRLIDPTTNGHRPPPDAPNRLVTATALPVSSGVDPMLIALRASAALDGEADSDDGAAVSAGVAIAGTVASAGARRTATRPSPARAAGTAGTLTTAPAAADTLKAGGGPRGPATAPPPGDGPCDDARRLADERCELAGRARSQANEAQAALNAARAAYDEHATVLTEATRATDPRVMREAKDAAQARFRSARAEARSHADAEAAAREWLHEINRINAANAEATASLQRARAAGPELATTLERAAALADAARMAAESAETACAAARDALATCEAAAAGAPAPVAVAPALEPAPVVASPDTLAAALRAGASPRIVRMLRGDRAAMGEAVAALATDDPTDRRRWQVALADLVDAIVADAIAASALEFPSDHPFWGPFSQAQSRDIAAALASLGYRFDGRGGWVDDRRPSQRDLSLALGYAALDPLRMRHWPTDDEMAALFTEVKVSAVEHLVGAAGEMTLAALVAMLGRRADGLAELWNEWDRVRPVLLDET